MKIDRQLGILSILFNFPMVELVCVGGWGKSSRDYLFFKSINPNGEVEDDLLNDLLDKSYHLVLGSFSKKK